MSRKVTTAKTSGKIVNPLVNEFLAACKANGFNNEEEITALSSYFSKCENEIRFTRKTITPVFSKILLRIFQKYTKLQRLIFNNCYFQDITFFTRFATDLIKLPITQVFFDFCPIQRDFITPFLLVPNLDVLSLRGNSCVTSYQLPLFEKGAFNPSLNKFFNSLIISPLKMLDLSGCNIGDDGAISVARALYFNSNLRCLNLSSNRIGDSGAVALADALSFYIMSDQEIEIYEKLANEEARSKISDDGADLVKKKKGGKAPAKKTTAKPKKGQPVKNQADRTYSFDPNLPVNPAVMAKWNTCVKQDDGTMYIQGNTSLTSLLLDDNEIGMRGYTKLSEMLHKNTKLINFSLAENPDISEDNASLVLRKFVQPETTE